MRFALLVRPVSCDPFNTSTSEAAWSALAGCGAGADASPVHRWALDEVNSTKVAEDLGSGDVHVLTLRGNAVFLGVGLGGGAKLPNGGETKESFLDFGQAQEKLRTREFLVPWHLGPRGPHDALERVLRLWLSGLADCAFAGER